MKLNELDIAWLAGLFEGEASFGVAKRSKERYSVSTSPPAPYCKIVMTDEDVINRVGKLVNKKIFIPKRRTTSQKIVYGVHIGDRETLAYLYPRLLPYMEKRRQEKIQEGINLLNEWQVWFDEGGRTKMARQGYKVMRDNLTISKSKDMISPDVKKKDPENG